MATAPRNPESEAALDEQTIDLLLSNIGPGMVLVGGQALGFWMSRFGIEAGEGVAISNDGDVLGQVAQAMALAQAMRARLELPRKRGRTAIVAQLRLPAAGGKERNIDVLHQLYTLAGPRKSAAFTRRVIADSVQVQWRPGRHIRVMDPFDMLESRAHNAIGLLGDKGPHVLTQLRWAIAVAQQALLRLARDAGSEERLGGKIQRIYTLARSQAGRRLVQEHGIELLDAVDVHALRKLAPAQALQLEAIERARSSRVRAARTGRARPMSG